ncbi:DUF1479-domain-containing protein [Colletotrichum falcatum]|nr:DUF1479-domain-containing protein [Colletotrichum falcatum]
MAPPVRPLWVVSWGFAGCPLRGGNGPAWDEYTEQGETESKDTDFANAKKSIIAHYGAEALTKSWLAVCQRLETVTEETISKGCGMVPVLDAADLLGNGFTGEKKAEAKRIGSFVVRGLVGKSEAIQHCTDLRKYVADNKGKIQGWPAESPSMLMLYDSPVQNALRGNPNHLRLQRLLNELWHNFDEETSSEPLVYYDGIRDRPPRQDFLGLGPHVDAGSLCRWADETDPADMMDASKWTLDDTTSWFPGTFKTESQRLSRSSHPHLRLDECLVHIPKMEPGDTVWWHTDVCHAVDPEHHGTENASVVYIAACPSTPKNRAYVKRRLDETRAGRPPPDYAEGNVLDERTLEGYVGFDGFDKGAKTAFGFAL